MNGCTNHNSGIFLHAYELGALSEQESQRFEMHLLECKYCFDQFNDFTRISALVANDISLRSLIAEVTRFMPLPESKIGNLWTSLWLCLSNKNAGAARLPFPCMSRRTRAKAIK